MLAGINEDMALPLLAARPLVRQSAEKLANLTGRRVMITGAGGSIGSELTLQVAAHRPEALIMVDHSELNLYEINVTLDNSNLAFERVAALADIRDKQSLRALFSATRPDVVFHAAALKHVPLLENDHNLVEAVRTNVLGTKHVLDLAVIFGAAFVMISTDKAVNPSSGMGLTKRCAEIYGHWKASCHPKAGIAQVRFGNVLGSSGSVVPLFRRQIAQGGPVTVTHPEMTRYLMTIKEAVALTLHASALTQRGYGSYVLDMGKPVRIVDLAHQLIEQVGLRPEIDVPIQIIGVRPGEKLHEELHYEWEELQPTEVDGVRRAVVSELPVIPLPEMESLLMAAESRDIARIKEALLKLVPSYVGEPAY